MKKLQCNFTTTKQCKRLLELGVPAWTADCYSTRFGIDEDWEVKILNNVKYPEISINNQEYCLPCWSVGRLIEIMKICNHPDDVDQVFCELAYSKKNLVELIVRLMEENKEITDFLKLEE